MPKSWKDRFKRQELREIDFCKLYKEEFGHGTSGHNLRMIIAKMAELLDMAEMVIHEGLEEVDFSPEMRAILKELVDNPLEPIPMVIRGRLEAKPKVTDFDKEETVENVELWFRVGHDEELEELDNEAKRDKLELELKLEELETQPVKENAFKSIRSAPVIVDFESPPEMDGPKPLNYEPQYIPFEPEPEEEE